MPRSRPVSFRAPQAIADAVKTRMDRGEYGTYRNLSELQTAQNVYMAFFPKDHLFTVALAKMKESEQDEVHDFALRLANHDILLATLTDEKPVTAASLLKLARKWPEPALAAMAARKAAAGGGAKTREK
jgi:hypothetical protein